MRVFWAYDANFSGRRHEIDIGPELMLKGGCVKQDIDPPAAILDRAAACGCCDLFGSSFCLRPLEAADLKEIVPILILK